VGERRIADVAERPVVARRSMSKRSRCHVLCAPELKIEPTFTIEVPARTSGALTW
jgi:hypothetical protein